MRRCLFLVLMFLPLAGYAQESCRRPVVNLYDGNTRLIDIPAAQKPLPSVRIELVMAADCHARRYIVERLTLTLVRGTSMIKSTKIDQISPDQSIDLTSFFGSLVRRGDKLVMELVKVSMITELEEHRQVTLDPKNRIVSWLIR